MPNDDLLYFSCTFTKAPKPLKWLQTSSTWTISSFNHLWIFFHTWSEKEQLKNRWLMPYSSLKQFAQHHSHWLTIIPFLDKAVRVDNVSNARLRYKMSTLEGISFTQRWFKAHTTFSSIVDETTLYWRNWRCHRELAHPIRILMMSWR
jgi:hypothetical protein